jgi:hypothetical protein
MTLKASIAKTADLLHVIWAKARVPTKAPNHVLEHIQKLHGEWQGLKKLINRASATNLANQEVFKERLDDLFDVAHRDAMTIITLDEDRKFLEAQREKGRRGTIGGVDRVLAQQEERVMVRRVAEANRAAKAQSAVAAATAVAVLDDSSSDDSSVDELPSESAADPLPTKSPRLRGKVMVVTRNVSAALIERIPVIEMHRI